MNKKTIFSSLLFVSVLLTGCATNVYVMSPEEAKENIISNFTPDTTSYRVLFEGVSNIFNRSFEGANKIYNGPGYEHRTYDAKLTEASKSNYLNISNTVNVNNWFSYKGSDEKILNIDDEFYFVSTSGSVKYVYNGVTSEEFKGNNGSSYQVYPGTADNSYSFLNVASKKFLSLSTSYELEEIDEITDSSSFNVSLDEATSLTNIINIAHPTYHLSFDGTSFKGSESLDSNVTFYVTAKQGRKTIDSSTLYGFLSRTFIFTGSNTKIYIEETSGTVTKTLPASADPVKEEAIEAKTIELDVDGGMHIYLRSASCMITLYSCHYVDGWTELSSVWARWNVDLYFNNHGQLVYESISSSNYPASLKESIYTAGYYTYVTR